MPSTTLETAELVRFTVWALDDPRHPRACAAALIPAIITITERIQRDNVRAKHHDFWDACVRFISIGRCDADVEELDTLLGTCACSALWRPFHKVLANADGRPAELLVKVLSAALAACFALTDARHVWKPKHHDTWPTRPADLIPHGAAEHVDAVLKWDARIPGLNALGQLTVLLLLCRAPVEQALLTNERVAQCVILALQSDEERVRTALDFLLALKDGPDACPGSCVELFRYDPRGARVALQAARSVAASIGPSGGFALSALIGAIPSSRANTPLPTLAPAIAAYAAAYQTLSRATRTSVCVCGGGPVTSGVPLVRCAGCRVARYCSRKCQREAWRRPDAPHEAVCAATRALPPTGGNCTSFIRACERKAVPIEVAMLVARGYGEIQGISRKRV